MRRFVKPLALLLILTVTWGVSLAHQYAKPEDAIRYRKAVMSVIGKHFGSMAGVVKGQKDYDKAAFAADASVLAMMSKLPWEAFLMPGSLTGDTKLKEEAQKDADGYMAVAKKFEEASQKLLSAAQGGDMGEIKAQFGATAKTCGGCHKPYRK